jgi:hypothetical protein
VFVVQASHQLARYGGDHATNDIIVTDPAPQWLRGWSVIVEEVRQGKKPGVAVGSVHAWIVDRDMGAFTSGTSPLHLVGMPGTAFSAITVASFATRKNWSGCRPGSRPHPLGLD